MLLERISVASDDEIGKIILSLREHWNPSLFARFLSYFHWMQICQKGKQD